jgi:hypothetical protein
MTHIRCGFVTACAVPSLPMCAHQVLLRQYVGGNSSGGGGSAAVVSAAAAADGGIITTAAAGWSDEKHEGRER